MPNLPEYNDETILAMEKEMVGVYLSGHPLSEYEKELDRYSTANSSEIAEIAEITDILHDGSKVVIGGIIIKKQNKITKNNNMMAFLTLEDLVGTVEVIIFPKIYESYKDILYEDNIILVEGTLNVSEDEAPKLICNKISEINKSTFKQERKLYIKVKDKEHYKKVKKDLFYTISRSVWNKTK